MYLEVYPDIIFIINFVLDYILLYLLKKVNRKNSNFLRISGAAAAGALIACIAGIFIYMNVLIRFLLMYIAGGVLMVVIAFGRLKLSDLVKQVTALYFITYFVGGLINSVYYHTDLKIHLIRLGKGIQFSDTHAYLILLIILIVTPIFILLAIFNRKRLNNSSEIYEVELVLNEQRIRTKGLMDSGNCLYDPLYKKPVMVIDNPTAEQLISKEFKDTIKEARNYIDKSETDISGWNLNMDYLVKLRFIPYQSIGKKRGMLVGFMLDKVLINNGKETICNEKVIAAISDNRLSAKEEYQVILHKELL